MHVRPLLVVLFLSFLAARASAQTAATISGTVEDPDRRVLPGVTVTVRNVDTSLVRAVTTGPEGRYVIPGLPPGVYDLRAELEGSRRELERAYLRPTYRWREKTVRQLQASRPGRFALRLYRAARGRSSRSA